MNIFGELLNNLAGEDSQTICDEPMYAARTDIELIFGRTNVQKWADLDNEEDQDFISSRICWALAESRAAFDDRLRGGPYTVPFEEPYPRQIIVMSARLAGVILYDSRGVADSADEDNPNHALTMHRKMVEKFFQKVLGDQIRLDQEHTVNTPSVVD